MSLSSDSHIDDLISSLLQKFSLTEKQLHSFSLLLSAFIEENSQINLSSVREEKAIIERHFVDSLEGVEFLEEANDILDFGCGGGFPLFPLSIFFPEKKFLGLDSVQKKLRAIDRMATKLSLSHVKTLWGRGEELAHKKKYRASFDVVVSRATAPFPMLLEIGGAFIKKGGFLVSYRSPGDEGSCIALAEKFSFSLQEKKEYTLPGEEKKHQILCFKKQKKFSSKLPRLFSQIKTSPLS